MPGPDAWWCFGSGTRPHAPMMVASSRPLYCGRRVCNGAEDVRGAEGSGGGVVGTKYGSVEWRAAGQLHAGGHGLLHGGANNPNAAIQD
eukprot:356374-Chlamydomonas_euryale.AAC.3